MVLEDVKEQVKAALIAKRVHEVEELLTEAGRDARHRIDTLKAVRRLNVVVKLVVIVVLLYWLAIVTCHRPVWLDVRAEDWHPLVVLARPAFKEPTLILLLPDPGDIAIDSVCNIAHLSFSLICLLFKLGLKDGSH